MMKFAAGVLFLACLQAGVSQPDRKSGISNSMEYGPYAVGFQLRVEEDPTRSFPSDDPAVPRSRPIRVYIWYPAAKGGNGPAMKVGDFIRMAADDFRLTADSSTDAGAAVNLPVPLAKGLDKAQVEALSESSLKAILGAEPEPGTFPLLVLGQGLYYESPLSHVFLCEYLASRGYVVASCPLLGTQHRLVNINVEDLETAIRDLEFVVAVVRSRPGVHPHDLGVVGYDLGGMAGLILSMRNPDVDCYLSLDSGFLTPHFSGLPGAHPQYREDRFTIPWMHLTQARIIQAYRRDAATRIFFDRKSFGDSYLVSVPTNNHGQFTSYGRIGIRREVPGYWGAVEGDPSKVHDEICRLAGLFFDRHLKNDEEAGGKLREAAATGAGRSGFLMERKAGEIPPPSRATLIHQIIEKGVGAARPAIEQIRSAYPGHKALDENELNWLGYHFMLWWGREEEAVEVFRLNVELYPGSANAYDSLGEAYLVLGRTEEAIAAYRKSLELNPKNDNAAAVLERLTKKK